MSGLIGSLMSGIDDPIIASINAKSNQNIANTQAQSSKDIAKIQAQISQMNNEFQTNSLVGVLNYKLQNNQQNLNFKLGIENLGLEEQANEFNANNKFNYDQLNAQYNIDKLKTNSDLAIQSREQDLNDYVTQSLVSGRTPTKELFDNKLTNQTQKQISKLNKDKDTNVFQPGPDIPIPDSSKFKIPDPTKIKIPVPKKKKPRP